MATIAGDELVPRLRAGDDEAFADLVTRWSPQMTRVARLFVSSNTAAEEVVQETWTAMVTALPGFEGRSSLRTWVFAILANRARTHGAREARVVPFSALAERELARVEHAVDRDRFDSRGNWGAPPPRWDELPEPAFQTGELRALLLAHVAALPTMLRLVLSMRDIDGCSGAEVAEALDISPGHVRVLLHRARSRLRATLEEHLA